MAGSIILQGPESSKKQLAFLFINLHESYVKLLVWCLWNEKNPPNKTLIMM